MNPRQMELSNLVLTKMIYALSGRHLFFVMVFFSALGVMMHYSIMHGHGQPSYRSRSFETLHTINKVFETNSKQASRDFLPKPWQRSPLEMKVYLYDSYLPRERIYTFFISFLILFIEFCSCCFCRFIHYKKV